MLKITARMDNFRYSQKNYSMAKLLTFCCFCTLLLLGTGTTGCKTKEGCAINQEVHVDMSKKRYKSKSRLFPKQKGRRN